MEAGQLPVALTGAGYSLVGLVVVIAAAVLIYNWARARVASKK